jgi:aflatoxin B1 aldehyde reductase
MTELDDVKKSLEMFRERGYKELDTARMYCAGKQEAFTREAGWKERGLSIATKVFPVVPGDHKPDVLVREVESSLVELSTDSIDVSGHINSAFL